MGRRRLVRMFIVGYRFGTRSERRLCEETLLAIDLAIGS